jgi:hypothetical protein
MPHRYSEVRLFTTAETKHNLLRGAFEAFRAFRLKQASQSGLLQAGRDNESIFWSQVAPHCNHQKIHARPDEADYARESAAYTEAAEPELRELRAGSSESDTSSASSSASSGSGQEAPPAHSVDFGA